MATIAFALIQHDVPHLRVPDDAASTQSPRQRIEPVTLIRQLAAHSDTRVREALIPLFLRHPEYHRFVPEAEEGLDARCAQTLRHLYTAAVYLQHLWHSCLNLYLGPFPDLPNYFGENDFGLSSPQIHWGEAGLRQLAARFEKETHVDWLSVYESAISRFLAQQQLQSTVKL